MPPLLIERKEALSPKHNPYFNHADVALFLAKRDGRPVGRISAQVDRNFLAKHGAGTGHFGMIDAIDNSDVFQALTGAAETWLRHQGMRRVIGPFSLSINEEVGLLIDGFDTPPTFMMGYAAPYHGRQIEAAGYRKVKDLLAYRYETASAPSPSVQRMVEKAKSARIVMRKMGERPYAEEVRMVLGIYNDAWADNWGSVPFTDDEIAYLGKSMRPILDPKLVWIAEVDGKAAGMVVVFPNINEAIADLDGRLLPFGWAKLLWRLKVRGVKSARVALMGIRREFARQAVAGSALPFLLVDAMRRSGIGAGYQVAELGWILEDNWPIRRVIEAFGGKVYKTYRLYEKELS